ncbi:MAG: thioredoxin domain-containing protein [Gammaproteobacteria bacterium]
MPTQNRLANETSPYLLQHAENPVDWYPWGVEALTRAVQENKPILLSIGYSACHWCHVMAHESFEDEATAAVMNELFVNIKVDREERPDLDKIYQNAHMLLAQRGGGWPLTVFLTPDDQVPFFAGTYFPPEPRHGLMSFKDLCQRIAEAYQQNPDAIRAQNEQVLDVLASMDASEGGDTAVIDRAPLDAAVDQLAQAFDSRWGGFGSAPKFPHPSNLERLLCHWAGSPEDQRDERALNMALLTLRKMGQGGIFDQLGGGFCRYSVDERWEIPHFEKMLYDNGPLLGLYAQAWVATSDRLFHDVAMETGQWVMDEMQSPLGGYYSSLDADSEGEEGRFYVWGREELKGLLSQDEYKVFAERYGINAEANFEGAWHLKVVREVPALVTRLKLSEEQVAALLGSAHEKLFETREQRVHPGRDEKILTSWNALMIKGMAIAGRHLRRWEFIASADRALAFLHENLSDQGRLLATYKDGKAHLPAYLDDHAYLLDALLEYLQADWKDEYLAWAMSLADTLIDHFEDTENGGFYFTADDHEQLIVRSRTFADDAMPSGNGVATRALIRLGHLLGEARYLAVAERAIKAAWPQMVSAPMQHGAMLIALEDYLNPPQQIVLRGDTDEMDDWLERTDRAYAPGRQAFAIPSEAALLPGVLAQRTPPESGVLAYVCTGTACDMPFKDLAELRPWLNAQEAVYTPRIESGKAGEQ